MSVTLYPFFTLSLPFPKNWVFTESALETEKCKNLVIHLKRSMSLNSLKKQAAVHGFKGFQGFRSNHDLRTLQVYKNTADISQMKTQSLSAELKGHA